MLARHAQRILQICSRRRRARRSVVSEARITQWLTEMRYGRVLWQCGIGRGGAFPQIRLSSVAELRTRASRFNNRFHLCHRRVVG